MSRSEEGPAGRGAGAKDGEGERARGARREEACRACGARLGRDDADEVRHGLHLPAASCISTMAMPQAA